MSVVIVFVIGRRVGSQDRDVMITDKQTVHTMERGASVLALNCGDFVSASPVPPSHPDSLKQNRIQNNASSVFIVLSGKADDARRYQTGV